MKNSNKFRRFFSHPRQKTQATSSSIQPQMSCSHGLTPCTRHAFTIKNINLMGRGGGVVSIIIQQTDLFCSLSLRKPGGAVLAPSVETPPSLFRLPAGNPEVELILTARCSAGLPGAAAPAPSQGPSCCGNTSRNSNRSQPRHPETLPLAAPFTIPAPPAQAQHRGARCSAESI